MKPTDERDRWRLEFQSKLAEIGAVLAADRQVYDEHELELAARALRSAALRYADETTTQSTWTLEHAAIYYALTLEERRRENSTPLFSPKAVRRPRLLRLVRAGDERAWIAATGATFLTCVAAITYTLERAQRDPDLGYYIGPGTETFRLLCTAEAALRAKPLADVEKDRGRDLQPPHSKREPEVVELRRRRDEMLDRERGGT
jgi:hypothetical protein